MPKIITTSELQKKIGSLLAWISKHAVIVTNRGKAKVVMLPYFEESDEVIERYMEDYEMYRNADKLKKELQESYDSGIASLIV